MSASCAVKSVSARDTKYFLEQQTESYQSNGAWSLGCALFAIRTVRALCIGAEKWI